MWFFLGLMLLLGENQHIESVSLDEVSFQDVVSSASMGNKTFAWMFPRSRRPKSFLLIYDYEKATCLEVHDERLNLSIFSTIIPAEDSFFVVDNTSGKYAEFRFDGTLVHTSFINRWEGYQALKAAGMIVVNTYGAGLGIASFTTQSDERAYALVDFKNQNIQTMGLFPASKDKEQYLIGFDDKHYLIEPGLGRVSRFLTESGKISQTIYQDPYSPVFATNEQIGGMRYKVSTHLSFYGVVSLQLNHFYDEDGVRLPGKPSFKSTYGTITSDKLTKSRFIIVGTNSGGEQCLVFDPDDPELKIEHQHNL